MLYTLLDGKFNLKNVLFFRGKTGGKGSNGKGGRGGKEAKNGRQSDVSIKKTGLVFHTGDERRLNRYDKPNEAPGENGIDGKNCPSVAPIPFDAYNPSTTFSNYKYYVREHLANDIQISNLNEFLAYLDRDSELNAIYNTNGLIYELESIERHYFRLRDKISFIPFFESLAVRIANYSRTLAANQLDERHAINYLYTALKSRQFALETHANYVAVTDLPVFLQTVKERMERFQETQRTQYIIEYRDIFKATLDQKIVEATGLIDKSILPAINDTIEATDARINELLGELSTAKDKTQKELQKAKENQETLQTKLLLHEILSPFKLLGASLSLFGPQGMAAGAAIGGVTALADSVIDSTLTMKKVTVPTKLVKAEVERITKQAKSNFENLEQQRKDLDRILKIETIESTEITDEFQPIKANMDNLKVVIQTALNVTEIPNADQAKQLQTSREQLLKSIETAKETLEARNSTKPAVVNGIEALGKMKSLLTVGQTSIEIYGQLRDDDNKLLEANVVVSQIEQQMQLIHQHEQNIYKVMLPELRLIGESVNHGLHLM